MAGCTVRLALEEQLKPRVPRKRSQPGLDEGLHDPSGEAVDEEGFFRDKRRSSNFHAERKLPTTERHQKLYTFSLSRAEAGSSSVATRT